MPAEPTLRPSASWLPTGQRNCHLKFVNFLSSPSQPEFSIFDFLTVASNSVRKIFSGKRPCLLFFEFLRRPKVTSRRSRIAVHRVGAAGVDVGIGRMAPRHSDKRLSPEQLSLNLNLPSTAYWSKVLWSVLRIESPQFETWLTQNDILVNLGIKQALV